MIGNGPETVGKVGWGEKVNRQQAVKSAVLLFVVLIDSLVGIIEVSDPYHGVLFVMLFVDCLFLFKMYHHNITYFSVL
jgi:hypothetical protein